MKVPEALQTSTDTKYLVCPVEDIETCKVSGDKTETNRARIINRALNLTLIF